MELPFGIFPKLTQSRFDGWYMGGGVTGGYQWILSKYWNLEASLGVGYDYIRYDKFGCRYCGKKIESAVRHYVGPTKAVIAFL